MVSAHKLQGVPDGGCGYTGDSIKKKEHGGLAAQRIWQEDRVLAALAAGATVVTGSKRLARTVLLAHADAQAGKGVVVWERPLVWSWSAFLSRQFSAAQDAALAAGTARGLPSLLSAAQVESLWERVIRASAAAQGLLQPAAAAQAAQAAWTLCREYRLEVQNFGATGDADAAQFADWAADFAARCDKAGWLDAARLPELLADVFASRRIAVPAQLLFTGFDECTPLQQHLMQVMREAGSDIEWLDTSAAAAQNARRVDCDDAEQELWSAARWAGALLERDANTRIGIVVRDLSACRERFARILDQVLCPSACTGAVPRRPYNLSLGQPLTEWPVVHDALLLLRAAVGGCEFNEASRLLRSPFFRGAETEQYARARLELRLRKGAQHIPLTRLTNLARERDDVPQLVAMLDGCLAWQRAQPRRQLPSQWARSFAELLRVSGWPGERRPDSEEFQSVEALRDTLGELGRLDSVFGTMQAGDAVQRLSRLAAQSVFQPASDEVPVQVMGTLESAGLHFDHVWITGLFDEVWPASPRPDPLIPVALQRRLDLPHASARRELEFARRISARLFASASEVVVSVPRRNADQELRPSSLIVTLPLVELADIPQRNVSGYAQLLHEATPTLEYLEDARGPMLSDAAVHGGTGLLKAQAACPFQAFAGYRLNAGPMQVPTAGLDPAERGSLLHDVLYRVWGELGNHTALAALDAAASDAMVARHVGAALAAAHSKRPGTFAPRFMELERQRLQRLVMDWLHVERARPSFEVEQREYKQPVQIGPLAFNSRVDRIDRLGDGSRAIIDYKTGDSKPMAWGGTRPDEPQLPCYAVTDTGEVSAVLFGVLRADSLEYRGYVRDAKTVPGITAFHTLKRPPDECTDWQSLLRHWREVLTRLAEDFAAGEARVDPKDRNRTCRYCHLAAVCRIDETVPAGGDEDE